MIKNFFTIALRNLKKHSFYSTINIFGLTIGITACLIILLYVRFELSSDQWNEKADRIYRVEWELFLRDTYSHKASVTPPVAEAMVRDFPEVEEAARIKYRGSFNFRHEEEVHTEWQLAYVDNSLFQIFSISFVAGNPASALENPYSMVISEKCAEKYFPGEDALGQVLVKDNNEAYEITGVYKDFPANSHFHYTMLLSLEGLKESKNNYWIGSPYNTYVLLREGADPNALEAKFPAMIEKYLVPQAASVFGAPFMDDFSKGESKLLFHLRPLLDIHLHSNLENELEANGDITNVYLMTAIALFILTIASINFMNLTTARSVTRAREVGIRKVLGSDRKNLVIQFLAESIILSMISFILALGLTDLLLPVFNDFTGLSLKIPYASSLFYLIFLSASILTGIFAGLYPALVLSRFNTINVLYGNFSKNRQSFFIRRFLVVFQFFITVFLIICTSGLYQQMSFMQNKKLGFNKEQVIILRDVYNVNDKLPLIRDEILKNHQIINGTISAYFPIPNASRNTPLIWEHGSDPLPENSMTAEKWAVDYNYIPTMGMEIVAGRNFSRDFPSDSTAIILNETAVKRFGFQDDPIGRKIDLIKNNPDGTQDRANQETWTVIGVVKDFNFDSFRENIDPLGLILGSDERNFLAFRYETENTAEMIGFLKETWERMAPGEPFNYSFLDQDFERLYTSEIKLGKLFTAFTSLSIVIACLGLFALTAFTTEQRTKEIGIRKVMGASVRNIILLLSKEYSLLVLTGFLLAIPVAWYGIYLYLQQYVYKADISPLIYLGAGLLAFLLAILTMSYQSIRAAHTDPAYTLKDE